jgi:Zn2+/Cd2+-exporting ATPase
MAHDCGCHSHCGVSEVIVHPEVNFRERIKEYFPVIASSVLLISGLILENFKVTSELINIAVFGIAFLLVGGGVLQKAISDILKGNVFTEFFLMSIATIGAFAIGEYFEAVVVMLFYTIGEHFQGAAVRKAKTSIKKLVEARPENANVYRDGHLVHEQPKNVAIGEVIQVRSGEKIPLDGVLLTDSSYLNTSALTGEMIPRAFYKDEPVLAGMINLDKVSEIKVTKKYEDSSFSRILEMVENASAQKAKTERFIRKFAKVYTPIVVYMAIALTVLPYFFVENYVFQDWFYRALVFLVISCPCALVVSIPLGYFGGIGAASKNGILFKGANYLDILAKVDTVVTDKTGTLTKGVFKVQKIVAEGIASEELIKFAGALESKSTHPVAKAIASYAGSSFLSSDIQEVEEISGHGICGIVDGQEVVTGNTKLFSKFGIKYDSSLEEIPETVVLIAVNKKFSGYIIIADELKDDAKAAISALKNDWHKSVVMLSGDNELITQKIAKDLGVDKAYGNLLPGAKVEILQRIKKNGQHIVAFAGDGINDAPVLAIADVGIAMGAMGSDFAIETANVVIQDDKPSNIVKAIKISQATKNIVWQNIFLAFGVKIVVLGLGTLGMAAIWEAIFADVGVALLAILNAVRIQKMNF